MPDEKGIEGGLSHLDERGAARMVDVSEKKVTAREAVAYGFVGMKAATLSLIREGRASKGDVLAAARLAGIMAAKRTHELIPLCHSLPLEKAAIEFDLVGGGVGIRSTMSATAKTGVEMEALTAVAVAALTIYDMCKAVDRGMTIGPIRLERKSGGASGTYERADDD